MASPVKTKAKAKKQTPVEAAPPAPPAVKAKPQPVRKRRAKAPKAAKATVLPPEVELFDASHAEAAGRAEVEALLELSDESDAELASGGESARALLGDEQAAARDEATGREVAAEVLPREPLPGARDSASGMDGPRPSATMGALVLARDLVSQSMQGGALGKLFGAARGLAKAVATGLGASGSRHVDEYGKDPELTRALDPISEFLYERYWRVSVEGAELLPEGACIVVANHSGALPFDGPILSQALLRERPELPEARWLMEDQIFYAPFVGTLFNRLGAVRACPENALRLLSEGRPVIVFPEGAQGTSKPFNERYQLKRLGRGGFAKLAVRAGVPIVPAAVVGAEEALPLLGRIPTRALGLPDLPITPGPLPAKWSIRFGEPIQTEGLGVDDPKEIQELVDRTREEIEGMLRALLKDRRSVFMG